MPDVAQQTLERRSGSAPFATNVSNSLQSFLPAGLCDDVSLPISVALCSISVAFGRAELVLPLSFAVGKPATPFLPPDGAPPVSAAKDNPLPPIKRTKATAAVTMLRCNALSS